MAGFVTALSFNDRVREAGALAFECVALIESIDDPVLIVSMLPGPMGGLFQAGAMHETLRLANLLIGLADGDATMGNLAVGSPLSFALMERGGAKFFLGQPGFAEDFDHAFATARGVDPTCLAMVAMFMTGPVARGAVLADATALGQTAEALLLAEESGDDFALASALFAHGIMLIHAEGGDSETGYELLTKTREMAVARRFTRVGISMVDMQFANLKVRESDLDGAIALGRTTIDNVLNSGDLLSLGTAVTVFVESLLQRGSQSDVAAAEAEIERLAAIPVEPGFVMHEIPLLRMRARLARAHGDEDGYRGYVERYRTRAAECGFTGHVAIAEAM